jgi:hypothetical protein
MTVANVLAFLLGAGLLAVANVLAFLLGAGLLAVALLVIAVMIQIGRALMFADRLTAALRWPAAVPGDLHG